MAVTIALVDDDRNILTSLSIALQAEGFATRVYSDGETALKALIENPPDLAVLDIKMPRMDGMELLRRLREKSATPGHLPDLQGRGAGRGARPRDGRRRLYRQALLAAAADRPHPRRPAPRRAARAAAGGGRATSRAGADRARPAGDGPGAPPGAAGTASDVTLTVTEFLILEALAQRPGVVKSRNQLMDVAYQDDIYVDDRTIDSHIKRLRRKFRAVDAEFKAIETLYGVGYRFAEE